MTERPNFLIILADDLGFSDVGCFGSEIKTPNIDKLANEGLRFTDFHAAAACSPTRSMLLSGTDHHIAGIGTMEEAMKEEHKGKPGYEGFLNDSIAALPELLRDADYLTLMSGKWHLGRQKGRYPCDRGFDRSFALLPGGANHYGWEPQLPKNGPHELLRSTTHYVEDNKEIRPSDLEKGFYSSDYYTEKLIQYLKERSSDEMNKPFFAYLSFPAPHWPLQAPDEDIRAYRGVYSSGPEALRQERLNRLKKLGMIPEDVVPHEIVSLHKELALDRDWELLSDKERAYSSRTMEAYAGMVHSMDRNIGLVLDHLEATKQLNNTVVLFLSDNGAEGSLLEALPMLGSRVVDMVAKYYDNSVENIGRYNSFVWYGPRWAQAATAPGRLYKGFSSEGGIRVPMIIRYPKFTTQTHLSPGQIDPVFGTVMDITPTLLDLAGAKHPGSTYNNRPVHPLRGRSWVPYLTASCDNNSRSIHAEDHVTGWELFGRMAVRKGEWKVEYIPKPHGPEKWQLYNIKKDPGEVFDLSEDRKDKLQELLQAYEKYAVEVGVLQDIPQYGAIELQ